MNNFLVHACLFFFCLFAESSSSTIRVARLGPAFFQLIMSVLRSVIPLKQVDQRISPMILHSVLEANDFVMHVTKLKERLVTGSTISPSMWKKATCGR